MVDTMHYANGRVAENGDRVVLLGYGGPTVAVLYAVVAPEYCKGSIAVTRPNDPSLNLLECLHFDDVVALLPTQADTLSGRIALVPDTSE